MNIEENIPKLPSVVEFGLIISVVKNAGVDDETPVDDTELVNP